MKNGLTATRTKWGDEEKRLKVFSGKGGYGNHGFPIYKEYNRIDISYLEFSNNSNDLNELNNLNETKQDDLGVFIGILRLLMVIFGYL